MITYIMVLEKQCISDKCKCNLMASLHLLQLTLNTHNGVMMPELELRKTYSMIKDSKSLDNCKCNFKNIQDKPCLTKSYCVVLIAKNCDQTLTANHINTQLHVFG